MSPSAMRFDTGICVAWNLPSPWTVTWTYPLVRSSLMSRNNRPNRQNQTKMMVRTMAWVGMAVVVCTFSCTIHWVRARGKGPPGVVYWCCDTPMSPIVTNGPEAGGGAEDIGDIDMAAELTLHAGPRFP